MYQFNREDYDKRMEWYRQARFGMFIHWGLYAIPARGEWLRSTEQIPKEEYMKYFYEFDPRDYDPKKWARAAKNAMTASACLTASIRISSPPIPNAAGTWWRNMWKPSGQRA